MKIKIKKTPFLASLFKNLVIHKSVAPKWEVNNSIYPYIYFLVDADMKDWS